jgi:putative oxygen-independent coproporphyrinogen III oxidase
VLSHPSDDEPAPSGRALLRDGALPADARSGLGRRPFGVYLHVPFCAARCGYCDFNTYTATELGEGATQVSYAGTAVAELALARQVLGPGAPAADTVFVGGGTPTLLDPADLGLMLDGVRQHLGLRAGAEVTCEANPDSVTQQTLESLRRTGFTRISFGMQSSVPQVLGTLDRTHDPARVPLVAGWARAAGLDVSLDLIYGTPGESLADWRSSVGAALDCRPDHVSAYALVVEPGTALAARVRRGELPAPDDDDLADKYQLADEQFAAAGLGWYEVSNWSRSVGNRCRHNLGYWAGGDWWGVGPGAHSHVGGVRWWNVRHPRAYAGRLAEGVSPAQAREVLDADQIHSERVLLGVRVVDGLPFAELDDAGRLAVAGLVADGLAQGRDAVAGRVVLTRRGRLLADTVVRALLP